MHEVSLRHCMFHLVIILGSSLDLLKYLSECGDSFPQVLIKWLLVCLKHFDVFLSLYLVNDDVQHFLLKSLSEHQSLHFCLDVHFLSFTQLILKDTYYFA